MLLLNDRLQLKEAIQLNITNTLITNTKTMNPISWQVLHVKHDAQPKHVDGRQKIKVTFVYSSSFYLHPEDYSR